MSYCAAATSRQMGHRQESGWEGSTLRRRNMFSRFGTAVITIFILKPSLIRSQKLLSHKLKEKQHFQLMLFTAIPCKANVNLTRCKKLTALQNKRDPCLNDWKTQHYGLWKTSKKDYTL